MKGPKTKPLMFPRLSFSSFPVRTNVSFLPEYLERLQKAENSITEYTITFEFITRPLIHTLSVILDKCREAPPD